MHQAKHTSQQLQHSRTAVLPLREKNDIFNMRPYINTVNSSQKTLNNQRLSHSDRKSQRERQSVYENILNGEPQHFFLNIKELRPSNTSSHNGKTASFGQRSRENEILESARDSSKNDNSLYRQEMSATTKKTLSPAQSCTNPGGRDVDDDNERNHRYPETDLKGSGRCTARGNFAVSEWNHGNDDGFELPPNADPSLSKENEQQRAKKFARVLFKDNPSEEKLGNNSPPQEFRPRNKNTAEIPHLTENELIPFVKDNLQFVTVCKEHKNQPLTLFNPITQQLACIECVYQQKESGAKKSAFVSFQNAFEQMSEHNKHFKRESQEKIIDLEKQLQVCSSNSVAIQENVDYFFTEIAKEFRELHEKLYERERQLVESLREAAEHRRTQLKTKMDNLEFLKICYQDAKEVDPNVSIEQCVHFYAVFNFLKNVQRSLNLLHTEKFNRTNLEQVEFPGGQDLRTLIEKFGKIKVPKSTTPTASSKGQRMSVGNRSSSGKRAKLGNRSCERASTSPILDESMTTRNRKGSSPPNSSYLERETLRNKFKAQQKVPRQKTPESKSQQKSQDRQSVPTKDNKRESMNKLYRDSEGLDSQRLLYNVSQLRESKSIGRLSTIHTSPMKSESNGTDRDRYLEEFIASGNNDLRAKTQGSSSRIKQASGGKVERNRQAEDWGNILTSEFTKENYGTSPFNLESITGLFLDSRILIDETTKFDMVAIFSEQIRETQLLYRLSQHGPSSEVFHTRCDKKAPILAIVHANNNFVFGYYMSVPFESEDKYTICEDSFLFSLRNPELSSPLVFPIRQDKTFIAVHQSMKSPCLGSTIPNKQDLWIQ